MTSLTTEQRLKRRRKCHRLRKRKDRRQKSSTIPVPPTSILQTEMNSETSTVHVEQRHVLDVTRTPEVTTTTSTSSVLNNIPQCLYNPLTFPTPCLNNTPWITPTGQTPGHNSFLSSPMLPFLFPLLPTTMIPFPNMFSSSLMMNQMTSSVSTDVSMTSVLPDGGSVVPFSPVITSPYISNIPVTPLPFPPLGTPFLPSRVPTYCQPVPIGIRPRPTDSQSDDGEQWSARYRWDGLKNIIVPPPEHSIPPHEGRIHRCPHCQALLYKRELTKSDNGNFGRCCGNGNIKLPDLPVVLEELNRIFRQPTYRSMSRKLNHALAFACWKCNEDKSLMGQYQAISCIRVQGCAYMLVGSVEPEDPEEDPTFIQVFFNSKNEEEAILRTAKNAHIDPKKKHIEWLTTLHRWIRDNNLV